MVEGGDIVVWRALGLWRVLLAAGAHMLLLLLGHRLRSVEWHAVRLLLLRLLRHASLHWMVLLHRRTVLLLRDLLLLWYMLWWTSTSGTLCGLYGSCCCWVDVLRRRLQGLRLLLRIWRLLWRLRWARGGAFGFDRRCARRLSIWGVLSLLRRLLCVLL